MFVIQCVIGIVAALGIGFILADILKLPTMKAAKAARSVGKKGKKKTSSLEVFLNGFADELSGKIKLREHKKEDLRDELLSAGMSDISPELFISRAIVKAGAIGILSIPAFFVFKILGFLIVAVAIGVYFMETKGITRKIKRKRERIEEELPIFVGFCHSQFKHTRNVKEVLTMYKRIAGPEMKEELDITLADMTGNARDALTHLQGRIGSIRLNEVVQKLQDVLEGHYSETAWELTKETFMTFQKQDLKLQANAIPRKMRKNSMALLFCFILLYMAVLGQVLMTSIGTLF